VNLGPAENSALSYSQTVVNTSNTQQEEEQTANNGQVWFSKRSFLKTCTNNLCKGKRKRYTPGNLSKSRAIKKHRENIHPTVSDPDEESGPSYKVQRPSNRRHKCFRCDQAFNVRSKFTDHLHTHHAGQFSECKHKGWCTKIFRTDEEKTEHVLKDHKTEKKCNFCHRKYPSKLASLHMSVYHSNLNLLRCKYYNCGFYFRSDVEKLKHQELFHVAGDRQIKCIFCGVYLLPNSLRRHLKNIHKSQLPNAFKCTFHCFRYFLTKEELNEHIASFHKKAVIMRQEYKCIYCNQTYPHKSGVHNHITRCHQDIKIRCKFYGCGQYFHTQTKYKAHLEQVHRKVEEEKRFQCSECNFRTEFKNNFEVHWLKVHEAGNIPCPKCKKCFNSSVALKSHLSRTHTDPELCEHCHTKFVHLRNHQERSKCKNCQLDIMCIQSALLHSKVCKLL
jgi:hypothetical protein